MPKNQKPVTGIQENRIRKEFLTFVTKTIKSEKQSSRVIPLGEVFRDKKDSKKNSQINKPRLRSLNSKGLIREYKMNTKPHHKHHKESDLYHLLQIGINNNWLGGQRA